MRPFQLAAIIVASLGVSATMTMKASVTFDNESKCPAAEALTTAKAVKDALSGADSACKKATVKFKYSEVDIEGCPDSSEKVAFNTVSADLTKIGTIESVLFQSLEVAHKAELANCKAKLNTLVDNECGGTPTEVQTVEASTDGKKLIFKPTGSPTDLKKIKNDLLITFTACSTNPSPSSAALQLEAVYQLKSPSPSPKDVKVTFAEADCQVTECAAATVTDSKSAIACLDAASKDSRCKTADYTRTIENVGGAACDDKKTKLHMSLDALKIEESEIDFDNKAITLTDAHFPMRLTKDCKTVTLVLAKDCSTAASGTPSTLKQTGEDKKTLDFSGEQTVDLESDALDLIAEYSDDSGCTLEADTTGDKITVTTKITIPHGDSPSGNLARFSFTGLLMAAVYVISAL